MIRTLHLALPLFPLLLGAAAPVHEFLAVAIAPDGAHVASIEGDEDASEVADVQTLVIRPVAGGGAPVIVKLPCGAVHQCTPSSPAWAPDGRHVAFILRSPGSHAHAIYLADAASGALNRVLAFDGTLDGLLYGPDGQLAVLATAGAGKEVGAVEAGAAMTGVLGGEAHEQRIGVLTHPGSLHWASPPDLFVYQYDWRPDGRGFVGTAAHGDGDNHWWVARLYAFDAGSGAARAIYTPSSPQQQLADPVVSPDGRSVAFIGGLMSDFGATGGEAYLLPLAGSDGEPDIASNHHAVDLTPDWPATVTSLSWGCDGSHLLATVLHADQTQVAKIGLLPDMRVGAPLVSVQEYLGTDRGTEIATDCHTETTAVVHQSFTRAPEIEAGRIGAWRDITATNAGQHLSVHAMSLTWHNGAFAPQGWLLVPDRTSGAGKLPMITEVHGGPAWANQPFFKGKGDSRALLDAGYALFLPNPRGSFGQGEAFTRANVRDFGYGDLRDILAGVDAAERAAPIDDHRLGLTGWSYGGYMTMFAVTQTQRFRAAVAGAGIANWQSYYGENGIDAWMIPYFGASVYADPAVYAKSAPITFIRRVRTPTLEVVGESDIECPAPQTEEFWHALSDLGVPTQSIIYPGEGHRMRDPRHIADFQGRTLAWFGKYLH